MNILNGAEKYRWLLPIKVANLKSIPQSIFNFTENDALTIALEKLNNIYITHQELTL